ncbi:MAG: homocysteine S-methyltransferase family protein [Coriobacteriia bacterium]
MPDVMKRVGLEVLVIDGAMGTMLQRAAVPSEQCPEQLNLTAPDIIEQIHRGYALAGADCATTNSFGGTRVKLAEYGLGDMVDAFNRAAVQLARRGGSPHVLADVGPTGLVMEPLGGASFDEVFDVFAEQVRALAAEGPDAIVLETFTDLAEARCALLAARSVTELPVFVSLSYGLSGRTELSGTDPETAAVVLEACGASAIGMNCGLGPEQMLPLLTRLAAATSLPVFAQPNAGLPRLVDGETVFPGTPDEMGEHAARFVDAGAALVGSCCGSTPAFTGAIGDFAKGRRIGDRPSPPAGVALASARRVTRIGVGLPLAVIGERINPTGKKALAQSLREGSLSVVREYAVAQEHAGAGLLDVNVGAAGVDAATMLPEAVRALSSLTDLPLVIDTTDPVALERSLKAYPGRALVNSVNGGEESLRVVLPLVKRYGAAVVALALDGEGIPKTREGRLDVVRRIRDAAAAEGLGDGDLVVDCLTLTAATDADAARTTLETLFTVAREWGLATTLGVSNVSHGLPGRSALNAAFLAMAAADGLSSAIVDPHDADASHSVLAADVLLGRDVRAQRWIAHSVAGASAEGDVAVPESADADPRDRLKSAVERGDADGAPALVDAVICAGTPAERVVLELLTPVIQSVGDAFGRGEVFLPQLMVAADAMKAAVARVRSHLPETAGAQEGRVVFATVKGDIHSIGKDICVSLLESQGFAVQDLGVDVAPDVVAANAAGSDAVCLSALMTTTLPAMEATVRAVAHEAPGVPVLVGGAVVTADYATSIGAGWAADAPGCVRAVRSAIEPGKDGAS